MSGERVHHCNSLASCRCSDLGVQQIEAEPVKAGRGSSGRRSWLAKDQGARGLHRSPGLLLPTHGLHTSLIACSSPNRRIASLQYSLRTEEQPEHAVCTLSALARKRTQHRSTTALTRSVQTVIRMRYDNLGPMPRHAYNFQYCESTTHSLLTK